MTEIVEGQNPVEEPKETLIEESPGILKPSRSLKSDFLEEALSHPDFRGQYPFSTEIELKYSMARELLNDGRIEDPTFLLDELVPSQAKLSRSTEISDERREEVIELGKKYKESLENFMVEKGIIEPKVWSVKRANQEAPKYIENNERFKSLVSFFGASNAVDILYRLHPQFQGVAQDRVKGMIAEYLGDFLLQAGPPNFDNIADKLPYLSDLNMREGLVEVWKRDALSKISEARKNTDHLHDEDILKKVFDEYTHKVLQTENEDLINLFDEVERYYMSILDIQKPEQIVTSLNGGREFPDLNQRINIKEIEEKKRLLIADEMGLGKSASAILAKEILGVKNALIISPSNVISVWQNFLSDRVNGGGKQIGYFKEGRAPRVLTVENPDALVNLDPNEYDYILLSQERLNDAYMSSLQNLDIGMLIVDEFHKLKNLKGGVRAGHLVNLAERMEGENKYVALLSGTPVPNKVEDIAIALKLLYPDKFKAIDNSTLIRSIIQGDIIDLRSLLLPRMQAKNLSESLSMPELTEIVEYYDLQGAEKDIYEELLDDDELPSTEKLQVLRQFLLNPQLVDPTPGIASTKVDKLKGLIGRELEEKNKVIVFVNDYTNGIIRGEGNIIEQLGIPEGVQIEIIDGPVSTEDRLRIQREMSESDGKMVVFVSGQTADVGVDFSAADSVNFYNEPWSRYTKRQQLARVWRPGVKHPITSTTLIGRGTIEEGISRYILVKERAIEKLLKGIPTTEAEKQILEKGEHDIDSSLGVNPELAEYYFSSWDRMNKIFAHVKDMGQDKFIDFLRKYAQNYAGAYTDLGSRSYQANASRVAGTLIDRFVKEAGQTPDVVKILDIASGPEMLRKHIADGYEGKIYSLDINKLHFNQGSENAMVGSFLNLPVRDETFDYANLSLSWHYTSFKPGKENLERIEVLVEANRVLKVGGRLVLNNIYSINIKDELLFREATYALGFDVINEYSGEATGGGNYLSRIFTLQKRENPGPGMSPGVIAEAIGTNHFNGFKLNKRKVELKDTRKVLTEMSIDNGMVDENGEKKPLVLDVVLNENDKRILAEEKEITAVGENLKQQYGGIDKIPRDDIVQNNFVRILVGIRYVLFKKILNATGAVIIR